MLLTVVRNWLCLCFLLSQVPSYNVSDWMLKYIYIQRHTVIISYIIILHYALVLYIILKYFIFSYVFML